LCSGEGISLVERFDEAAFFQLFGQGRIDELFRLRQRSFTLKLVFDEKLNCLQRRPRAFLQGRRVVLPGSFEDFLVADLAVLGKNFFAEFLVAAVAVHGAREGAQKAQRDIAPLCSAAKTSGWAPSESSATSRLGSRLNCLSAMRTTWSELEPKVVMPARL